MWWIWSKFKKMKTMCTSSASTVTVEIYWIIRLSKRKKFSPSRMLPKYLARLSMASSCYIRWGTCIEISNLKIFCWRKTKLAIICTNWLILGLRRRMRMLVVLCLGLSIICHLKFIAMTTIAMKLICGPLGSYFTLCSIWSFLSVWIPIWH